MNIRTFMRTQRSAPTTTCALEDSAIDVQKKMFSDGLQYIPVVDEKGKLLGIVTLADLTSYCGRITNRPAQASGSPQAATPAAWQQPVLPCDVEPRSEDEVIALGDGIPTFTVKNIGDTAKMRALDPNEFPTGK